MKWKPNYRESKEEKNIVSFNAADGETEWWGLRTITVRVTAF